MSRSVFLAALTGLLLAGCAAPVVGPEKIILEPVRFSALPAWEQDRQSEALPALARSCAVLGRRGHTTASLDWRKACAALAAVPAHDDDAARRYFEQWFQPYAARGRDGYEGLFTGYYEASLRGALRREGVYQIPVWQRPEDMISVDLGDFRAALRGQKIVGKVMGHKLKPYDDRAAVAQGALRERAQPLFWTDDAIDVFFLEIQGSGRVQLAEGGEMRVGYAAQNGHDYVAIGRVLLDEGALDRPVTMAKIRDWLKSHPEQAQAVMNRNPSVVFFREIKGNGPIGAQGVALTPRRSLAVDPSFVPLGVPVWLDVGGDFTAPSGESPVPPPLEGEARWGGVPQAEAAGISSDPISQASPPHPRPLPRGEGSRCGDPSSPPLAGEERSLFPTITCFSRFPDTPTLLIAQDTGGAIKGAVRGDLFWGHGPEAEAAAGAMQARGRYYLLLPKAEADGG